MEGVYVNQKGMAKVRACMCVQLAHELGEDEQALNWSQMALVLQFENGSPGPCMV